MFVCELCRSQVAPHTPAHRIVLAWRAKHYPLREYHVRQAGRARLVRDEGGSGYEIAREAWACPACAARYITPEPPTTR